MIKSGSKAVGYVARGMVLGSLIVIGASKLVERLTRYDSQGFNRNGYNKDGFDRDGYDVDGFDRFGRDAEGYDRNGFDRKGYNREGYDRQGYDRNFYSKTGLDRAGRTPAQYSDLLKRLYLRLQEAQSQLDKGDFRYAVSDARTVLEEVLRLVVEHAGGIEHSGDCILENLKICENRDLLSVSPTFIDRLHDVRHICNKVTHELDASDHLTHQKTFFVIMQTGDLMKTAEKKLCCA